MAFGMILSMFAVRHIAVPQCHGAEKTSSTDIIQNHLQKYSKTSSAEGILNQQKLLTVYRKV